MQKKKTHLQLLLFKHINKLTINRLRAKAFNLSGKILNEEAHCFKIKVAKHTQAFLVFSSNQQMKAYN